MAIRDGARSQAKRLGESQTIAGLGFGVLLTALAVIPAMVSAQEQPVRLARPGAMMERTRPTLITRATPAGAPVTGLRAAPTAVSIKLLWACPEGATGYEVFATPKGGEQIKLPADPNGTLCLKALPAKVDPRLPAGNPAAATGSYTHAELTLGAEFTYVVRALYPGGYSDSEALTVRTAATAGAPVITSLEQAPLGINYARNGDQVVVQGSSLDGLTSVAFQEGFYYGGGYRAGTRTYDPPGYYLQQGAPPIAVAPVRTTSTSLTVVPELPVPFQYDKTTAYFVIVTKGQLADTSNGFIQIGRTLPVQKITGVKKAVVRSGMALEVNGLGLDEVEGGYFGTGALNSNTNPYFSIAGRTSTRVHLQTRADCNQEGILMLKQRPIPGLSSDGLITGGGIKVACVPATPKGSIVNSESLPNGVVPSAGGSKASIKGTNLKWVTRVLDQNMVSYPFTYSSAGPNEWLAVTLPAPKPDAYGLQFFLENDLIDPVEAGSVSGSVLIMAPPSWNRISPTWAEAGQNILVHGRNIKFLSNPVVTVGGVPAQVIQADHLTVQFRLGAGTTTGPIEIQNEAGTVQLTGPFTAGDGSSHPGFFVVAGPSSITEIVPPRPTLAYGDTLLVRGQNLARLSGVCVISSGQGGAAPGNIVLRRIPIGHGLGYEKSNTEMLILLERPLVSVAAGPIQLYAPTAPARPYPPSQFACAANPGGVQWP